MFKFLKLIDLRKSPSEKLKVLIENGDSVRNIKKILGLLVKNPEAFSDYNSNIGYYFDFYDKSKNIDTRFRIFKTTHTTNIDPADNYSRYVFSKEDATNDAQERLILIVGKKKKAKYVKKSRAGEETKTLLARTGKNVLKLYDIVNSPKYYLR